jgi:hypothetical protein
MAESIAIPSNTSKDLNTALTGNNIYIYGFYADYGPNGAVSLYMSPNVDTAFGSYFAATDLLSH